MKALYHFTLIITLLEILFAAESSAAKGDDNVISMHYDEVNSIIYFDDSKVTFDGITYQFVDDDSLGIDYTIGSGTIGVPTAVIVHGGHFEAIDYDDTKTTNVVFRDKFSSWWGAQPILPGIDNKGYEVSFKCQGLDVYFGWDKSLSEKRTFPVTLFTSSLFRGKKNLESAVIPGFPYILDQSFENCTNLKEIEILNGCSSIMYKAFYGCKNLEKIIFPESLKSIGMHAFDGCSSLKSIVIPDKCSSIGHGAFQNCKSLENVHFPDSLTELGAWAFNNCENLSSVFIPNKIKEIKEYTFNDCESLSTLSLPNSLEAIGNRAFSCCRMLGTIILPDSLKTIGFEAFWGTAVKEIFIPSKVSNIEEDTFGATRSLSTIVVATKNKTYDSRKKCNAIIEKATNMLVAGCGSTIIPESVESIRKNSFSCITIDRVFIPQNVHLIENLAYRSCEINTIEVSEDNKTFDSRNKCNAIIETNTNKLILGCKNTEMPNSIIEIGQHAFDNVIMYYGSPNSTLVYRDLNIPQGVQCISDYAFYYAWGIGNLIIPSSVSYIGENAFKESVKSAGVITTFIEVPFDITENAFSKYESITLYVPKGTKAKYESTAGWKNFQNIVEMNNENSNLPSITNKSSGTETTRYDLRGHRLTAPQRGVNIVRISDGTVRKDIVK